MKATVSSLAPPPVAPITAWMALASAAASFSEPTVAVAGAPALIQAPTAAISFLLSGVLPSLGMKSPESGVRFTRWNRSDPPGLPATITGPLEPPFIRVS